MEKTTLRVEKWDNLKFFLIFLVVLGHICDYFTDDYAVMRGLFLTIYTFHMPLFIFISGLFSKKNIDLKRYNKIFSYLALYIVLKIILFISRALCNGDFKFSYFYEGGLPWYVLALVAFSLITICVKKISPVYVLIFSIVIACFAGYDNDISKLFALSRIITYFPFFYLGYYLDADKVQVFLSKKYIKIISAVILIVFVLIMFLKTGSVYWLRPVLSGQNPFSSLRQNFVYGGFYRLLYYPIAFIIGASVISLTPSKIGKGHIAKLGSRSIQIYSLHYVFIIILYENLNLSRFINMLLPEHPLWMIFPVALAIVLICSLKIWTPIFDAIMKPKQRYLTK